MRSRRRGADRPLGDLPDEIAVSVITAAELELGVLRARDPDTRATRTATLSRVRATYPLLPVDEAVASCHARLADQQLRAGRKPRRHDTWIAATAMRHHVAVLTQDQDFAAFEAIEVIRV
jgi:predicted nucleic acid-binding protein